MTKLNMFSHNPALGAPRLAARAILLDRPIWSALNSAHSKLAEGDELARRYPREISPFAAMCEITIEAYESLKNLISDGEQVALFTPELLNPPKTLQIVRRIECDQMISTKTLAKGSWGKQISRMELADVPEMLDLAEITKPGPFGTRTHELGTYLGIRDGGKLVAMAGERMRFDGFVEVSAVCVHPEHRGNGYARTLTTTVMQEIRRSGAVPFLHVIHANVHAASLYRQLGFVNRMDGWTTVLQNAP